MKSLVEYINESIVLEKKFNFIEKIKQYFRDRKMRKKFENMSSISFILWADDTMPSHKSVEYFEKHFNIINDKIFKNAESEYDVVKVDDLNDMMYVREGYQYIIDDNADADSIWKDVIKKFKDACADMNSSLYPDMEAEQSHQIEHDNMGNMTRDGYIAWCTCPGTDETAMFTIEFVR